MHQSKQEGRLRNKKKTISKVLERKARAKKYRRQNKTSTSIRVKKNSEKIFLTF